MPTNNEFLQSIATGEDVSGVRTDIKFGRNSAVSTTEVVIQDIGGSIFYPSEAGVASIVSDDVADDSETGQGAWTIKIKGLDANWDEIEETITMNGTTPVVSTQSFLRLNRMKVITAGTENKAVGNITASIGGTDIAQIQDGDNQTLMANYSVPRGYKLELLRGWYSLGQGKDCVIRFRAWDRNTEDSVPQTKFIVDGYQDTAEFSFPNGFIYPEKTDLYVTGVTSTGTISVSSSFLYKLILDSQG